MPITMLQILSLAGAFLVLAGFAGQQYFGMKSDSIVYGLLNFIGSLLLAWSAVTPLNAGVLVLESVWAAISLNVVLRAIRARRNTK